MLRRKSLLSDTNVPSAAAAAVERMPPVGGRRAWDVGAVGASCGWLGDGACEEMFSELVFADTASDTDEYLGINRKSNSRVLHRCTVHGKHAEYCVFYRQRLPVSDPRGSDQHDAYW